MFFSVYQVAESLLMLQCGICIGFIYSAFMPLRLLGGKHKPVAFFADFIFALLSGGVFVLFTLLSAQGELHFYAILSTFCGFLLQYAAMRPIIRSIRKKRHERMLRTESENGREESQEGGRVPGEPERQG